MNPTFWELVVPLILAFGLFLAWRECSLIKKSREAEVLMHISQIWDSDEYLEARKVVFENRDNLSEKIKEYEKAKDKNYFVILRISNFFEIMGLLVDKKYLPLNVMMELRGSAARYYYKLYKKFIEQSRHERELPFTYEYFEHLASRKLNERCSPHPLDV